MIDTPAARRQRSCGPRVRALGHPRAACKTGPSAYGVAVFLPPPSTVRLDPALPAHHRAIVALAVTAFADRGDYRAAVEALLADADVWRVVAHNGSDLLGFFAFYFARDPDGTCAWLPMIAVAPDARGRGLGPGLLSCALRMAARGGAPVGATQLRLHVGADQTAARALFQSAGFERAPEGDGRYGRGGAAALCLQRDLRSVETTDAPERVIQLYERRHRHAGEHSDSRHRDAGAISDSRHRDAGAISDSRQSHAGEQTPDTGAA